MRSVEFVCHINGIPKDLMEPIQNGDYELTRRQGEIYNQNNKKEVINLLIGTAYLVRARGISQERKELIKKGGIPAGYLQMEKPLSGVGANIIRKNLQGLTGF